MIDEPNLSPVPRPARRFDAAAETVVEPTAANTPSTAPTDTPASAPVSTEPSTPDVETTASDAPVATAGDEKSGKSKKKWLLALLIFLLILLLALVTGGITYLTRDKTKAVGGVTIGGVDVGGMTQSEIEQKTVDITNGWMFTVVLGDHSEVANVKQLGVNVDAEATAQAAMQVSDGASLLHWINPFSRIPVEVTASIDIKQLQTYLIQTFPEVPTTPAKEPEVVYDHDLGEWVVAPGAPGQGVSAASVLPALVEMVLSGEPGTLQIGTGAIDPVVSAESAQRSVTELQRLISNMPTVIAGNATPYTFTVEDFTDWLLLTPDGVSGGYVIGFDESKIVVALETTLAEQFFQEALPEVQLRDAAGNQTLAIAGREGLTLADPAQAAAAIAASLAAGDGVPPTLQWQVTTPEVKIAVIGPVHPGEHWADVNLTTQTLTLFDGATPVHTIWISSGKPETPTPQGHHPVAAGQKDLDATLIGRDFHYEHVTWIGWSNVYGVHSAYWHGNFGRPQSHGCVNVSPDQIMEVYNWLDIGDYIEVHE
ncbi:MAG: L,D-transpeptidase family protein [Propionibacteriaceae bacterium]|nr:L,D-transpeptidase family protein [Propionibacteriaceae bacterium]